MNEKHHVKTEEVVQISEFIPFVSHKEADLN